MQDSRTFEYGMWIVELHPLGLRGIQMGYPVIDQLKMGLIVPS